MNAVYQSLQLTVSDPAHVDAARRAAVREAEAVTANETLLGRLTVVVQEMARNLVNHADGGELLVNATPAGIALLAVDSGPGMTSVAQCLADSYSTTGTMGAGLGAIRRMSDTFDLFSQPGMGTVVYAFIALDGIAPSGFMSGAVCTPHPSETVCGDAWAVKGNRVMICDGLGHGHNANTASALARSLFLDHDPQLELEQLLERTHRALSSTRGGAIAFAEILPDLGQVRFCGAGNIAGVLLGDRSRSMVSANGTVGYRIGRIQSFSYPWDRDTLLVMSSDGISGKWGSAAYPGLHGRHPAIIAALIHRDYKRLNDDATVVVVRSE
ncbi:ATP-binding protein [Stutzerimonas azotifigens]|uniref:SpoIIE family protein phosphatase n=1 Tax=Stutzerimonas azotifigens TaxID=291995 RepID=A0ABR5Z1V7_9GAMM|nr:SpoIIE family protein phosphatase [Stutzerimonas azotifigens]MBA1274132.1 SpoIIE family protein phosphatase [Stutzerimonas azotifigens]